MNMKKIILLLFVLIISVSWVSIKKVEKKSNRSDVTLKYIDRFKKTAMAEHNQYCIPASITLAQGILESASGQSKLVNKTNNHFGIKCIGNCNNKNSYMMADDDPYDRFIKYKSAWFSYRHHSRFLISNSRYEPCFKCGNDYKCWAKQLKKCGYATSKTYDKKLIKIIETYKLYQYDK